MRWFTSRLTSKFRSGTRQADQCKSRVKIGLERLEDRATPAILQVDFTGDNGPGSLREALTLAASNPGLDVIRFAPGVTTVELNTAQLTIDSDVSIQGPSNGNVTIQRSQLGGTPNFRIFFVNNGVTASFSNLTIFNGNAIGSGGGSTGPGVGGGINNDGTATLTNCTIRGNNAQVDSGGIRNTNVGRMFLDSCTVSGNTAPFGAGILASGPMDAINTTISGNAAGGSGGGIFYSTASIYTLVQCTIAQNSCVNTGAGIQIGAAGPPIVRMTNTIVAGNIKASDFSASDVATLSGNLDSANCFNNLIGTGGAAGLTNGVQGNQVGVVNAKLGPLGSYGGVTQTHDLAFDSPALDAGTATDMPLLDQRGAPRPIASAGVSAKWDIGAFERQTPFNQAPVGIGINSPIVAENAAVGALVGTLIPSDPNPNDVFTYELVAGTNDSGNPLFFISGNQLRVAKSLDFETSPNLTVRVKVTDQGGLSFENFLNIDVTNADDPVQGLAISAATVPENSAVGTVVGTLSASDADVNSSISYSLVAGSGDGDNGQFEIVGNELRTKASFDFETKNEYSVRVRATSGATTTELSLQVHVRNVNEAPVNQVPSSASVIHDRVLTFPTGSFSTSDDKVGLVLVELSVTAGRIRVLGSSNAVIRGNNTRRVTMTGTKVAVNNALKTVTFAPPAGFVGQTRFTMLTDDFDQPPLADVDSFFVTVTNRAPTVTAAKKTYSVKKGKTLTVPVATGLKPLGRDADSDPLTVVLHTNVLRGTLTLRPDGSFTYKPPTASFAGDVTFKVRIFDGAGYSSIVTVLLQIR